MAEEKKADVKKAEAQKPAKKDVNKKKPKTPAPQPTVAVTQVQQNAPSADATVIPTEAK